MANTFTFLRYHIVFSTKNREPWFTKENEGQIWDYIGGIARENGMQAVIVGGYNDHVHALVAVPPTIPLSKAVQMMKGASSHWIHQTFNDMAAFAWQDGYGAFTVGLSQVADTVRYIEGQREHHRARTFQEEYLAFLRKHEITFDERFVWG